MRFTVSDHPELISIDLIERLRPPRRRRRTWDVLVVVGLISIGLLAVGGAVALALLGL